MCGILDNTLGLNSPITTERDIAAYQSLFLKSGLSSNWPATYFADCQTAIEADLRKAITNDLKPLLPLLLQTTIQFGQLAMWNGRSVLEKGDTHILDNSFPESNFPNLLNLIDISDKKSYLITKDKQVQRWLSNILSVTFDGNIAACDRLWLRKEIMRQDIMMHSQ